MKYTNRYVYFLVHILTYMMSLTLPPFKYIMWCVFTHTTQCLCLFVLFCLLLIILFNFFSPPSFILKNIFLSLLVLSTSVLKTFPLSLSSLNKYCVKWFLFFFSLLFVSSYILLFLSWPCRGIKTIFKRALFSKVFLSSVVCFIAHIQL